MKESLQYQRNLEKIFKDFPRIVIIIKDNYNFNYLNRLGINLLGYKESEISEMSFIELLTPDSLERCINNIRSLRKKGLCQSFTINILKKRGGILSLELSGVRLENGCILLIGRNLSLERIRKERLEYLEEFNKNILNSIGEGIVVLNLQGNIIKYNDFMEKNFQWKKNEIIGKNVFELFPDLKKQRLLEAFVNIVDKGNFVRENNVVRMRPGRRRIILNIRGYPLKRGRKTIGVIAIIEDITEREKISKQINKTMNLREKIYQITESIIPSKTIPQILDKISLGLNKEIGYERGAVFLLENDKKTLSLKKIFSSINTDVEIKRAKERIEKGIKKGKGLTLMVHKSGQAKIIEDIEKEKNPLRIFPDTRSEIIVPIRIKDESIGVITIDSRIRKGFDEIDLKFLEMLMDSVATTIDKTKFQNELLNKLQYLSILYETSQVLKGVQERKMKYGSVLKHLSQIFTNSIILILRFENAETTNIISSYNANKSIKTLFKELSNRNKKRIIEEIKSGNPIVVDNIKKKRASLFRELSNLNIRTLYIFPLFYKSEITGCLILLNLKQFILGKDQISFLTSITNQLSSDIYHLKPQTK